MQYFLKKIEEIITGDRPLNNRIDGQYVGNRDSLLSFIGEKFKQHNLIIKEIYESTIDESLKKNADKLENGYYFYQDISDKLLDLLKKTAYIQSLYVFDEDNCLLYADDNLEDITLTLHACF